MIFEMPNAPGFFLVENGLEGRAAKAISILYMDTWILVSREIANVVLEQKFKEPIFFVLWSDPNKTVTDKLKYKFWFTNEEDYALALLIK